MTNEELDGLILSHICAGVGKARLLVSAAHDAKYPGDAYRPVDRSLQRLRKAGKIRFADASKNWVPS